ncbi:N-acetylmuramoyl-L-alanine amidase AmiB [Xenorhabdus sp. Reich]|uniref:N-acetylmuramoyl-L-alanine amidase n=2 Tax=Xenorhabdus littoralis TaxID=2582835 RepID=A0ABU4SMZ3_9GAMM|nr:N-acetylmuramoyl-L-alanine amidase AmiB [Xenorhabdus sp. Reich]MDX7999915.1 N-acetylmuramoyl-L-alanine amidase AmiB [Xenorhabdus sp. Reich]
MKVCVLFVMLSQLVMTTAVAATLSNVHVSNSPSEAIVTLEFTGGHPDYRFSPLHSPERLMVDIRQASKIAGLPMRLSGQDLVRLVRSSQPPDSHHQRIVLELAHKVTATSLVKKVGSGYQVAITLKTNMLKTNMLKTNGVENKTSTFKNNASQNDASQNESKQLLTKPASQTAQRKGIHPVVIAIDAGHGGQDPGAIGQRGSKEKNVTISVARKLEMLLRNDPMFKPVLTRNGDYFISVAGRSEVARKHRANMLISIHADAAPNRSARGASVWVLSNRRANSELGNLLEQHEKQSELLGGAGDALANGTDPFLSQAVLDLQFGHSQRVGYDVAMQVLSQLTKIGSLHKRTPEHASLGVLRSPDIPSILVETGFISNQSEEELLGSEQYQEKLAKAIHLGLRQYFQANPLQAAPK